MTKTSRDLVCVSVPGSASTLNAEHSNVLEPRNPVADHADVIGHILAYAWDKSYLFVAGISKEWRDAWGNRPKVTLAVQSPSCLAWARRCGHSWDLHTCAAAARGGYMETLKYARVKRCGWNERTCEEAARVGHMEMLRWCKANRCPWDGSTCVAAARGGHLRILRWCRDNGCPLGKGMCTAAAKGGNPRVQQWCRTNGCP